MYNIIHHIYIIGIYNLSTIRSMKINVYIHYVYKYTFSLSGYPHGKLRISTH